MKTLARAMRLALVIAAIAASDQLLADDTASGPVESKPIAQTRSIWDGVFTDVQAKRGQALYMGPCSHCHGYKLDGAADDPVMFATPPVAGGKFLRDWDGRTLAALFEYTRATMPANNPGFLTAQEFVDVIAYMLLVSGAPPGDEELEPNATSLARFIVRQRSQ